MPDPGFFTFVVNLVKLGGLGVGALIFVMVFLILLRNQAADEGTARLRTGFLRWGAVFAILALVASSATELSQSLRPSSKIRLGVTISPDFAEAKLPPPQLILMPSGTTLQPNTSTEIQGDSTLNIQVRGIVESVKGLAQSSQTLLATNQTLTAALDQSSQAVHQADAASPSAPTKLVAASEISVLHPAEIAEMKAAQSQIALRLSRGQFTDAARSSQTLNAITASAQGLKK